MAILKTLKIPKRLRSPARLVLADTASAPEVPAPAAAELRAQTANAEAAASMLKSMANADRLLLLCALVEGELTVGELCAVLQLPQSTVSRHLKTLGDERWVASRADGPSRLEIIGGTLSIERGTGVTRFTQCDASSGVNTGRAAMAPPSRLFSSTERNVPSAG